MLIQFNGDPGVFQVETADGKQWAVKNNQLVRIDASSVTWDERGFVTIYLQNLQQKTELTYVFRVLF